LTSPFDVFRGLIAGSGPLVENHPTQDMVSVFLMACLCSSSYRYTTPVCPKSYSSLVLPSIHSFCVHLIHSLPSISLQETQLPDTQAF